jgi:sugar phosphate isomerase/epimerase
MRNPITFSTLACPEWTIETILARAVAFGYDGIEWRGGPDGHVQPSMSTSERARLRRRVADSGLFSLAVTAYTSFVSDDLAVRQENVDELRRYLDLAADFGARYVRVFLGELRPGDDVAVARSRIVHCLESAAPHAGAVSVGLAVEPHDDFVRSASVAPIFERVPHPAVGAVWDVGNTFAAGEDPVEGFQLLGKRLFYVQVKDLIGRYPERRLTRLGEGEVPLASAVELLLNHGYQGAFSVEWERAWYSDLDPAEVALLHALKFMRGLLAAHVLEKSP